MKQKYEDFLNLPPLSKVEWDLVSDDLLSVLANKVQEDIKNDGGKIDDYDTTFTLTDSKVSLVYEVKTR